MTVFRLVILPLASARVRRLAPQIKRGVRDAIRAIADDPLAGEPLKKELKGCWKYRVHRFRIVYRFDRGARTITIMSVDHRRTVYEELAATLRDRPE